MNNSTTYTNNTTIFGISFSAPDQYFDLTPAEKESMASLTSDTCVIDHDEEVSYYILGEIHIPIHGRKKCFIWDVWVQVSEEDFDRYEETWNYCEEHDVFAGILANKLPYYEDSLGTDAVIQPYNGRGCTVELAKSRSKLSLHKYWSMPEPELANVQKSALEVLTEKTTTTSSPCLPAQVLQADMSR